MELTHPIDQFCMPPSTNNGCLEADHNGGYVRGYPADLASLAAQLLPSATGPTCIFMQRTP